MLDIRQLGKEYRGATGVVRALRDVTLSVRRGEFVSIVGPSGCGKSTLFSIVAGLATPSEGDALFDGRSIVGRPGTVAYMPQKDLLMPWLRTIDNAALPLELAGMSRAEARTQAGSLFRRFGLAGFERHWPSELSGGMRQRASLLRTFLRRSDAVLLDEPFGALDALTRSSMHEWLQDVWSDDHPAVLFVTHDVDEALFLSDRVLTMSPRPGRILADTPVPFGRPRTIDLYGDPAFARLKQTLLGELRASSTGGPT
ncbi:MAG: ABC transporter ATP-binding protein [Chloroflexota bacterium]|nr:MAG: ABC transporter ATP-binding protein [Chloroflexota bacterium]